MNTSTYQVEGEDARDDDVVGNKEENIGRSTLSRGVGVPMDFNV